MPTRIQPADQALLDRVLAGPVAERENFADHLMTAEEARWIVTKAEKQMAKSQRGPVFNMLANSKHAPLLPEARAIYRDYAAAWGVKP